MSKVYADIIVDISQEKLDKSFQYEIPENLQNQVEIGKKVLVSFGNGNRKISGYVIGISDTPKLSPEKIKPVLEVVTQGIEIESHLIALAGWIAKNYGSTVNQALKTVLLVKEKASAKEKKYIRLLISKEEGQTYLEEFTRKHYLAKARLMEALLENQVLEYKEAMDTLKLSSSVIKGMEEKKLIAVERERLYRTPVPKDAQRGYEYQLSKEQKEVVSEIFKEWQQEQPRPCLIKGVTGSGKTQVYMELIEAVLKQGKQVIVLIPEIALTYQNVVRFYSRFGSCVSVINSRLSVGERFDQFERAKKGEISVVIGPRSALFTPFPNLGLIIIDEEHEDSYKSEKTPCYHARETAVQRGKMESARVVMGSASPSVDSYYRGKAGEYQLLYLNERYGGKELPEVEIVDLKAELKTGNRSIFSHVLTEKLEERLQKKEQSILFLNRRGYTGFVSCRSCGYVVKCPHCDVSLTAHRNGKMICHYCGYEIPQVKTCPSCGSPYIGGFKAGTQQIETLLKKSFPDARILRMDADTTKNKGGHEKVLSAFAAGEADILIGTQMIVKGHDFPNVTFVGVLAADLSLYSEDYRASEKTFQLLLQAVGRAGRGRKKGEAVIQTYHPEHYSILAAAAQDYEAFYQAEIGYRLLMDYPPAAFMTAIRGSCKNEELLKQAMEYCRKYIEKIYKKEDLILVGPAPEAVAKVQDYYKMVLYMRHENREILVKLKDALEKYIAVNRGFQDIYIQFDFNV
ncbi:replication restart helicase PriA [Blautia hansenii]|uniref:replication restart helicase PriA n=1 Tax=Blautia hansenii TaxID=1322 RepID=UPI0022DF5298|nr:primosomal protein N' [Blautia hansenii]